MPRALLADLVTLSSVEAFDLGSGEWQISDPMPVALHGLAMAALGDSLFVLGGSRRAGDIANSGDALMRTP